MVSHPVHLLDQMGNVSLSTFIPFCAFKTQLGISKPFTFLPDSPFPVCKSFIPVDLHGQLCYSIKVNMTGRNGNNGGLVLVLDMNEDRSLNFGLSSHPTFEKDHTITRLDERDQEDAKNNAKIHIQLLTPFDEIGGGSYKMTSVKKVKGTEAFLGMQEGERECRHGKAEECEKGKMNEQCKCVPWELKSLQVICFKLIATS